VLLFSLLVSLSVAAFDDREFKTPEGEALYKDLIQELRCLVCQNQNIADSDADLAVDLRKEIFTMIDAGGTRHDIIDFMVQRYGEFVWRSSVRGLKAPALTPDAEALARAQRILDEDT